MNFWLLLFDIGAHHIDLRGKNVDDPISVVKAREIEKDFIRKWLVNKKKKEMKQPILII